MVWREPLDTRGSLFFLPVSSSSFSPSPPTVDFSCKTALLQRRCRVLHRLPVRAGPRPPLAPPPCFLTKSGPLRLAAILPPPPISVSSGSNSNRRILSVSVDKAAHGVDDHDDPFQSSAPGACSPPPRSSREAACYPRSRPRRRRRPTRRRPCSGMSVPQRNFKIGSQREYCATCLP